MAVEALKGIGLAGNEAKVYVTLLSLGSAPVGKITQESGVHRRNVYDALERLMKRGLVGHVTKKRAKYFQAANPSRLLDILSSKRFMLDEQEKKLKALLPNMEKMHDTRKKEDVSIFWGREGVVTILNDIIKTGKENLVLGAFVPKNLLAVIKHYHTRRIRAKVPLRMIFNKSDLERGKKLAEKPYTKVRFMPKAYESPITINIYEDKVGLLIWSEHKPMGILMKNNNVGIGFREFFNMLWSVAETA
ncbi:MAG: helix-turn-helix domain-containing protein [Candidatus Aenigmarchaeota archaeon]